MTQCVQIESLGLCIVSYTCVEQMHRHSLLLAPWQVAGPNCNHLILTSGCWSQLDISNLASIPHNFQERVPTREDRPVLADICLG